MPLQSAPLRSLGSWPLGSGRWRYPTIAGQGELEGKERGKHKRSTQTIQSVCKSKHSTRIIEHISYVQYL